MTPDAIRRRMMLVRAAQYRSRAITTIAIRIGRSVEAFCPDHWQAVEMLARAYRDQDVARIRRKIRGEA